MIARLLAVAALLVGVTAAPPAHATEPVPDPGYRYLVDNVPIRWDPCSGPITWSVTTNPGDKRTARITTRVFAEVAAMTGYTFRQTTRPAARITIRWVDRTRDTYFTVDHPDAIGYARTAYSDPTGLWWGTSDVVLSKSIRQQDRRGRRSGLRLYVLRHEIAHAMGLMHNDVSGSVLGPEGSGKWADVDRAGLAAVGAWHGCAPLPGIPWYRYP